MKTYDVKEIEDYVANALGSMPWKGGIPPKEKNNSARFIILHVLKAEGITLTDNNEIRNSRNGLIGHFGYAAYAEDGMIEWAYMAASDNHYVVSKLRFIP